MFSYFFRIKNDKSGLINSASFQLCYLSISTITNSFIIFLSTFIVTFSPYLFLDKYNILWFEINDFKVFSCTSLLNLLFDFSKWVIDAFCLGDKLKFANHSSKPNCYAKVSPNTLVMRRCQTCPLIFAHWTPLWNCQNNWTTVLIV